MYIRGNIRTFANPLQPPPRISSMVFGRSSLPRTIYIAGLQKRANPVRHQLKFARRGNNRFFFLSHCRQSTGRLCVVVARPTLRRNVPFNCTCVKCCIDTQYTHTVLDEDLSHAPLLRFRAGAAPFFRDSLPARKLCIAALFWLEATM